MYELLLLVTESKQHKTGQMWIKVQTDDKQKTHFCLMSWSPSLVNLQEMGLFVSKTPE